MISRKCALLLLPLLSACAGTIPQVERPSSSPAPRTVQVPPTDPAPPSSGFRQARVMNIPGLESVIGQSRAALIRQFGSARLDVVEGDVRKLQFSGESCVLDIYLYPPAPGAEPRATWIEARRASDGMDVDRARCVAALGR